MIQYRPRPEEHLQYHPISESLSTVKVTLLICFIYAINIVAIIKYLRSSEGALEVNVTLIKSVEKNTLC